MKQNVSSTRQQQLVSEILQLIRDRDASRQQVEQQWQLNSESAKSKFASRRQQTTRSLMTQHDETESEYQRHLLNAREEYDGLVQVVESELEEKLAEATRKRKTERSDGEYDWFLSKQRLQKEHQSDQVAAREAYKKHKSVLKQHGVDYNDIASQAKSSLARHNCQLKIQGGDLLEDPDDSDHLAAHQQTSTQIQALIRQFQRSFWVRFVEERWFIIVFMLSAIALAYPLFLLLQNAVSAGLGTFISAFSITIVACLVARSIANRTARQFQQSFVTAIATGKQQLLAAQHQNKRRRTTKLGRLAEQLATDLADADQDWQRLQQEIETAYSRRETELNTWSAKRNVASAQNRANEQERLAQQFGPRLTSIQEQLHNAKIDINLAESQQLTQDRAEYEARLQALARQWSEGMQHAAEEATAMQTATGDTRLDYDQLQCDDWTPPSIPATAVQFGSLPLDLAQLPHGLSDDRRLQVDTSMLEIPVAIDLESSPSLLIETSSEGLSNANGILKLAALRMLTSIPPGKCHFTFIDPVGLGQNFAAFRHLADHDEQLVHHRIWTESNHINQRLADLTKHIENVIQSYLRNEFASIQEYNAHAGEIAEAFRVLVIANFPVGFSDEAVQRLLSIVSSGPRCGVCTFITVDPQQPLPRNFDLNDLRKHTNVMVADATDVRWSEPPLSGFPISIDALPSEARMSEIMHAVGRRAKAASRVEVPFSAVAPAEKDWWQGDSRAEISVPLGRAGATKLQSMHLGHGTSQHVLISGKTGSGKSTLMHAIITNLALNYSPSELQFYLIDFKKGVEFKSYAEHQLPHARVIAIESEREFGQSVLQRLDSELRRRGDLFRRVGVQSLAGYRDARPDEPMPRVLLVIDEFQEFFVKEDKIAQDASLLLDRLVRQGRAFGIHVLLGSQTLAGAYSLARATIGQMAVRIALQCSASDAHLILSDDNDAARLLRRPGDAIYNDANGMVEGNHPFQVVWLSDIEKENYLRTLAQRHASTIEPPIVFEGNVAADVTRNALLQKAWSSPSPQEIPLAPRAWVGEAVAIKEAPAAVFHRRSGGNLMLVGQQEEAALAMMASSLLSLQAFSPQAGDKQTRFVIFDGMRPESHSAGYWNRLKDTTGLDLSIIKPRDAVATVQELVAEVGDRQQQDDDDRPATFLLIYNLARFRELQKSEDDFGFGKFGEEKQESPAEMLANILREGPGRGVHTILWSDTHTNLMRWIDRQSLRDIESRILFQMSATDSSNLMESSAASQLGQHRAIFYSEDQGRAERFRPYGLPDDDFLLRIRAWHTSPARKPIPSS